jgi:hypothetical protein
VGASTSGAPGNSGSTPAAANAAAGTPPTSTVAGVSITNGTSPSQQVEAAAIPSAVPSTGAGGMSESGSGLPAEFGGLVVLISLGAFGTLKLRSAARH